MEEISAHSWPGADCCCIYCDEFVVLVSSQKTAQRKAGRKQRERDWTTRKRTKRAVSKRKTTKEK